MMKRTRSVGAGDWVFTGGVVVLGFPGQDLQVEKASAASYETDATSFPPKSHAIPQTLRPCKL